MWRAREGQERREGGDVELSEEMGLKRYVKEGGEGRGREKRLKLREGEEQGRVRLAFWIVAGIKNKERDFWEGLGDWDIIVFCETWMNGKGWKGVKGNLPRGYRWENQTAAGKNKKVERWVECWWEL